MVNKPSGISKNFKMNRNMGYVLIAIGLIITAIGVFLVSNTKSKSSVKEELTKDQVKIQTPLASTNDQYDVNKAKGDAFEKFVIQKFNKDYFTIQEWRSDKYVNGMYAVSNSFPDLEIAFELKKEKKKDVFAVECKWRKNYFKNEIKWAEGYQLGNYRDYAKKIGIPVFVVIGVGGEPENPTTLYIVPLDSIKSNVLTIEELKQFERLKTHSNFFWDENKRVLS